MTTLAATRSRRKYPQRETAFLAPTAGERRHLDRLLARVPDGADRVLLVGERPGGRDGLAGWLGGLPPDWHEHPRGHYLEGEHPTVRLVRPDGRPLDLGMAAAWYGDGDYTAQQAGAAWTLLGDELRRGFDSGAMLLGSPAATGRDLFVRSIPWGHEVATIDVEHQELIRSTTGQGRIELFPRSGELAELVGYDGRMMYAALCRELPAGAARHERAREYQGYTRARYNATAHVPRDWSERCECGAPGHGGLGLLGEWEPVDRVWRYPSEPGCAFSGWWDGAELRVALDHGWTFDYHTALVFDRPKGQGKGPLDGWAHRLIAARDRLALLHRPGAPDAAAVVLAGRAVRAVVLHTVGVFFAGDRRVTRSCAHEDAGTEIPAGAVGVRTEGDRVLWTETTPPAWPALCHPEWSAAIWARARSRLLTAGDGRGGYAGALHVPAASLVAFRTDAIYLDYDPAWSDDGRPGRFRRQYHRAGPVAAPQNATELVGLTR